ncbi:diguanylate cyclase, partial [Mesorhizobium sp. M00.F.Ca.ET.186.01.1.1]
NNSPGIRLSQQTRDRVIEAARSLGYSPPVFSALRPAGDWLLKCVAKRLQHAVRSSKDVVARFGGDEFAIIQFGIKGAADAEKLAKRIVEIVGKPYRDKGRE